MKNLRPRRWEPSIIDLTPLIDVVFLLLIFFMVSTTFEKDTRIQVQLPEAQGEKVSPEEPRALEITIDDAGFFYVDGRKLADRKLAGLQAAIADVVGEEGVAKGDTRRGPGMDRPVQRRPAVEPGRIGKSPFSDSPVAKPRDGLLRHSRKQRERPVVIRADAQTPHQAVMTAMDAASRLGLLRFSLAATRPGPTPPDE